MFGTMIEIPRAALTAGEIAQTAEFFSFGTNDLTQTTYGISRDDAETGFLVHYLQTRLLKDNPFTSIDPEGVGRLMQMAIDEGRASRETASRSGCAANTAATPRASTCATSSGWITFPAHRSGCPSPGWPRPTQR